MTVAEQVEPREDTREGREGSGLWMATFLSATTTAEARRPELPHGAHGRLTISVENGTYYIRFIKKLMTLVCLVWCVWVCV